MDGPRQILYNITYMWNLKYDTKNLSTKQKQTHRHREQTCDCQSKGGAEGGKDREFGITRCKPLYIGWINNKSCCMVQGIILNILQ